LEVLFFPVSPDENSGQQLSAMYAERSKSRSRPISYRHGFCMECVFVRYRPLLKVSNWSDLIGIPSDEEGLIRHFTLSGEDIDRVLARRGDNNQLGFAIQLCLMRYPSRALGPNETLPSAMLKFVAQQLEINSAAFADYARRDETRRDHAKEIQQYLGLHPAEREDRRAALIAASTAADATDDGVLIAEAIIQS
jgi:hypothetical protein